MTNLELAYEFENKLDATAVSFLGGKIEIHVPHPYEHEFLLLVRDVVGDKVINVDIEEPESCVITAEESEV